jgi:hypothetical protein
MLRTYAARTLNAGSSIFHNDTPGGPCADPRCRHQMFFWIWFPSLNVFSGNGSLEASGSQNIQDHVDVRMRSRRHKCLKSSLLLQPV